MFKSVYLVFLSAITLLTISLVSASNVEASDGFIELRSTIGDTTRCHITSVRLQTLEYQMVFICRDLKYTGDAQIVNYTVWINPIDGKAPINLGTLGLGRGLLKTKAPFSSVYVTTEENAKTKTPSGRIVLQGNVSSIPFLEEVPETPVLTGEEATPTPGGKEPLTEQKQLSTRDRLVLAFQRAGIAALLALVGLIGLVFVVTRSRG